MAPQVKPLIQPTGNVRNAKNGRSVSKGKAETSPATTVTERKVTRKTTKPCENCDGKGLDLNDYSKLCDDCKGTGKVKA